MTEPAAVRLGLIGAGRWGRNLIRTIASLPEVRLTWLGSRNPESRALVGPQCRIAMDWRDLVRAGDVDGVVIATPPPLHAAMVREAVAAGKPVLVEKPLTNDLATARELAQFVAAQGGYVLVDHTFLFHAGFAAMKQELAHCGPVRAIESVAGNQGPFRGDTPPLWDWGPHDVAMCLDLLRGVPESVIARRLEARAMEGALGENLELRLGFAGGIDAHIRIGNLMPAKTRRFTVHARGETLVLDDLAEAKLVRITPDASAPGEPISLPPELPLARAVRHFAQAIATGRLPTDDLQFALQVIETLDRCERAMSR